MFDPVATDQLTTRDMVTHRSGLPRHDLVCYTSEFPLESLVQRLRYLPPSKPIRANYQYNNLLYATAGHVAATIAGKPWEQLVRERIFQPLQMSHSRMNLEEAQKDGELALPYVRDPKTNNIQQVPPFRNMTVAPAGSIYSCVDDMAKYLLMHIEGGKTINAAATVTQMQSAQIIRGGDSPYPEIEGNTYGMGLSVSYYRGRKMVAHSGAIDGMRAAMAFLPKQKIGVIVLWNLSGSALGDNLPYIVFDKLLDAPDAGWLDRTRKAEASALAASAAAASQGVTGQRKATRPSHDLKEYAGLYEHPGYGRIAISASGDALAMRFNRLERPLEHFHFDTFQVPQKPFDPFEKFKLSFVTDTQGDIVQLRTTVEPNVPDTIFERIAEPNMSDPAFLSKFAGAYENQPQPIRITLQGTSLMYAGSKLIPMYGTRFRLAAQPSVSFEFRNDGALVIYTPGGVQIYKRQP